MGREDNDEAGVAVSEGLAEQSGLGLFERTREAVLSRPAPLSTYRLQLHKGFGFEEAIAVIPYLKKLGVTDLYSSPQLKAMPGSTHGYDVIDHSAVNPELGTESQHAAFCAAVRGAGMGHVLDTVPNHMGVERGNPLWQDVLENGTASRFAHHFDIDWEPVKQELREKVLLPVLGDQYGVVLERGELVLKYDGGAFFVTYFDRVFPLGPRGYGRILALDQDALQKELGADHPDFLELQSILTGIEHLPMRTETEAVKVIERTREKEIIKRRLDDVIRRNEAVRLQVEANVRVFNGRPGDPRSFDALDSVIARFCPYRLAHWRVAGEEINYRRFFDINGLAAIRVEEPDVFMEAHQRTLEWLGRGMVTGLRIDHPDGLFDPTAYFLNLQEQFFLAVARRSYFSRPDAKEEDWPELGVALGQQWRAELEADPRSPLRKALYVVVEKIQGGRERIPDAWAVHGTTGYRFANAASGIFVQGENERAFTHIYQHFIGHAVDFKELVHQKKRLVMSAAMSSELNVLAREFNRISEMDRRSRDFTLNSLRRALVGFIAQFPVYRTYVDGREAVDGRDVQYIRWTVAKAKAHAPDLNGSIFDFLEDILLRRYADHLTDAQRAVMLRFAMKVQQVTGPVMAKGLEDTAFYVYNRLASLNEVGGEPERFGTSVHTFHLRNQERVESWPSALLASSTHDTKRSEDVRARLNVLSELPDLWRDALRRFARLNSRYKTHVDNAVAPDANDEYLFYQTVVGAWPMGDALAEPQAFEQFRRRIREYMFKAIKEAKVKTSWTNADPAYEEAMGRFVDQVLDRKTSPRFIAAIDALRQRVERPGQLNALGQVAVKLGCPGVPDTYQGCELWDLSLVDPDNRRPVDFALRQRLLEGLDEAVRVDRATLCRELAASLSDGRAKMYLTAEGLRLRARRPELFAQGGYDALDLSGAAAGHGVAFMRRSGADVVVVMVPRLTAHFTEQSGLERAFSGTWLELPENLKNLKLRNVLTGKIPPLGETTSGRPGLDLGPLLGDFPVVLMESMQ